MGGLAQETAPLGLQNLDPVHAAIPPKNNDAKFCSFPQNKSSLPSEKYIPPSSRSKFQHNNFISLQSPPRIAKSFFSLSFQKERTFSSPPDKPSLFSLLSLSKNTDSACNTHSKTDSACNPHSKTDSACNTHALSTNHSPHTDHPFIPRVGYLSKHTSKHASARHSPSHRICKTGSHVTHRYSCETTPRTRSGSPSPRILEHTAIQKRLHGTFPAHACSHRFKDEHDRESHVLGRDPPQVSECTDCHQIHFNDRRRHQVRDDDRYLIQPHNQKFHESTPTNLWRSQRVHHHTNDKRRDEHTYFSPSSPLRCNHHSRMEKSSQNSRHSRDKSGWSLDRSFGPHRQPAYLKDNTHSPRIPMGQSLMDGKNECLPTSPVSERIPDHSGFHLSAPSIHPTSISSTSLSRDHHDTCPGGDQKNPPSLVHTQHPKGSSPDFSLGGCPIGSVPSPLLPSIPRWIDEVRRKTRQKDHKQNDRNAKHSRKVKFSSSVEIFSYSSHTPITHKLSSRKNIFFNSTTRTLVFDTQHTISSLISQRNQNKEQEREVEEKKNEVIIPSAVPGWGHPPKGVSPSFKRMLDFFSYVDFPSNSYSLTLPSRVHSRDKKSCLPIPLKPIVSSCVSPSILYSLALKISPAKAERIQSLFSLLHDVTSFRQLFKEIPEFSPPGPPSALSEKDVRALLEWKTISPFPRNKSPHAWQVGFKVPKSSPEWSRFILDCGTLNKSMVDPPSFHLPSPIQIICTILQAEFGFVADFSAWFFQHSLDLEVAFYFCFRVHSKRYYLNRLAQGWKFSPVIAQDSSEILAYDEADPHNHLSLTWIDDIFSGGHSHEETMLKRDRFIQRCRDANAVIGQITEVSTSFTYVGAEFDLKNKRWRVKTPWVEKAVVLIGSLTDSMNIASIWSIMGNIIWFYRLSLLPLASIDPLILFSIRLTHRLLKAEVTWESIVRVWPSVQQLCRNVLERMRENPWRCLSFSLPFPHPQTFIFSDASIQGGAVVFDRKIVWRRTWSFPSSSSDIFYLESLAWRAAIEYLVSHNITCCVTVTDNEGLYYALMKSRSRDPSVNKLIAESFDKISKKKLIVFAGWIETSMMPADAPSRSLPLLPYDIDRSMIKITKYPIVCSSDY